MNKELTDNQLEELISNISENQSEDTQRIRKIINSDERPSVDVEENVVNISIDNDSGRYRINPEQEIEYKDTDLSISKIADGTFEEENNKTFDSNLVNSINKDFDLSEEETSNMLNIIIRYKSNEKFNIYKEMPIKIQNMIKLLAVQTKAPTNSYNIIAKSILDQFIAEANIDEEFIDFQKSMEKELNIPSIMDMYSEHIRDTMEIKTLEIADKLQESYPEKAETLRKISSAFVDSYTFTKMKNHLITNRKARNRIKQDLFRYNRFCNNFNLSIKHSKFKINDVFIVAKTLNRILPEDISLESIQKFVILFCKTCESLNKDDVVDCAYIYYTIKNIIMLDYSEETKTEFSKTLINNIIETIDLIIETETKSEENSKNTKKK